jgi:hypothetical protein
MFGFIKRENWNPEFLDVVVVVTAAAFFPLASRPKGPDNASQCQNTTQIQS